MEPQKSSLETIPTPQAANPELGGSAEIGPVLNPEQQEGRRIERENTAPVQQQAAAIDPASVALPTVMAPPPAGGQVSAVPQDDSPMVAADDDLIEKEWVDKVKDVINKTKDNPHARENSIKKLQIEYVKKRYGKIIGDDGLEAN